MPHPDWVLKHKKPKTEIRKIKNNYYLYEVSSKWDPQKKRAKKITGKILGKITPQGFVESHKRRLEKQVNKGDIQSVSVKEFGVTAFILEYLSPITDPLKILFKDDWQLLMALAYTRLLFHAPIKNMPFHFSNSFLSEEFKYLSLTDKKISNFLRNLGLQRENIITYFKQFVSSEEHILIDATAVFTQSENLLAAKYGYNNKGMYLPQVNLIFIFSLLNNFPIYYRITPGNIREISSFKLSMKESGIEHGVVIGDKGFYSDENIRLLKEEGLEYIIPLRRNSRLIDYTPIKSGNKKNMDGYFEYQKRYIWYALKKIDNDLIIIYLDEHLKSVEEKDYLSRIQTHPERYTLDTFYEKQFSMGTFSVISNLISLTPKSIYQYYKSRNKVEQMFDVFKNLLMADRTYMQNDHALEGWMFINTIALQWYYKIYQLLVQKKLLSKYSIKDFLIHLSEIKQVKINGQWHLAEINSKTKNLIKKLELNIPIT